MTDDQYRRLFLEPAEMPTVSADFVRTEVVPRVKAAINQGSRLFRRETLALLDLIEGRCKEKEAK